MSAYERSKGAQGEREFCELLRSWGHINAKRNLGQTRDGGGDVPCPPVMFEVKRRKKIRVRQFLDQAVKALPQYPSCKMAAVAMREDGRTEWMILLRAEDFRRMLEASRSFGVDRLEGLL